ncbi:MAG: serpin family protein [Planctomycetota bacterium]
MKYGKVKLPALLILGSLLIAASADEKDQPDAQSLVKGNTAFALDLYQELKSMEGNLFISPFSVSSALAMTYAGARGETEKEMARALRIELAQNALPPAFKKLFSDLENHCGESNRLAIANGLCLTGGDVGAEFKKLLVDYFAAETFKGEVNRINEWVSTKTEGRIKEILKKLMPNTVCVLLNAIYFKGAWETPFDEKNTSEQPFTLATGKTVKVPLMQRKRHFRIMKEKGFSVLELPYEGEHLAMIVLLPDKHDGLVMLERKLDAKLYQRIVRILESKRLENVMVHLPRFRIESDLMDLVPPLKSLGMHIAFDPLKADFQGMGWAKGELWISQVKHRAFVEVNEEGTEAAGATAVEMQTRSRPQYSIFRADHPFLFIIRDKTTGSILFLGRVVDPSIGDG